MTAIDTKDEKAREKALDEAIEDSMDASDPPAITKPGDTHEPADVSPVQKGSKPKS